MSARKVKIDWDQVGKYLEAHCSGTEIAGILGIHENTLYTRCLEDQKVEFGAFKLLKRSSGDGLLKIQQFKKAMNGDKTMLVWLGKQRLGQKDKHELEGDIRLSPFLEMMKEATAEDAEADKEKASE